MDWWKKKKMKKQEKKKKQKQQQQQQQILKRGTKLLEELIECCDGKSNPIKFYSADEIYIATNNFSESNYLAESSFFGYKWYSGKNDNHHKLLITQDVHKFNAYLKGYTCRDIAVSSMVSGHKNFMKLVGCCLELEYQVMVYHGVKKHYKLNLSVQTWKRRMKIAQDIATALAYLHTAFPRPFVYRTLSPLKILLDEDGVAKLRDFSFCVSIPKGEAFVKVESPVGLYNSGRDGLIVSEKTDVFAIGMFMGLTLLVGTESVWNINDWLLKFKEEVRIEETADPKMLQKMGELSEVEISQMKAFRMLSLRCMDLDGEVPTMVEVAKELKKIQRLIIL